MWGQDTTYDDDDDDDVRRLRRLTGDVRDDGIRHAVVAFYFCKSYLSCRTVSYIWGK